MITKEQAKTLAVRYCAFNRALDDQDDNGVLVWGRLLISSMDETGVEISSRSNLDGLMYHASRRLYAEVA